jgi:hypothetical protein
LTPPLRRERRQLLILKEHGEMRSLAVALGRHNVLLPWVDEPKSVHEIAAGLERYSALPVSGRQGVRHKFRRRPSRYTLSISNPWH